MLGEIKLTPQAELHLRRFEAYFGEYGYDAAYRKLLESLSAACNPNTLRQRTRYPAPRPFPGLKALNLRWLYHHRYWFAYTNQDPPMIAAIIDATSNIARHASHLLPP
jgi:hypothetical protein